MWFPIASVATDVGQVAPESVGRAGMRLIRDRGRRMFACGRVGRRSRLPFMQVSRAGEAFPHHTHALISIGLKVVWAGPFRDAQNRHVRAVPVAHQVASAPALSADSSQK